MPIEHNWCPAGAVVIKLYDVDILAIQGYPDYPTTEFMSVNLDFG